MKYRRCFWPMNEQRQLYERKMYRYKAQYSLDCENGIENAILHKPQTPEMALEEKQSREQLYSAVMTLPKEASKEEFTPGTILE